MHAQPEDHISDCRKGDHLCRDSRCIVTEVHHRQTRVVALRTESDRETVDHGGISASSSRKV